VDGGRSDFTFDRPVAESLIVLRPQAANPPPDALRTSLADLLRYRHEYLSGDEKGESQVFCDRLFRAFGHEGVREAGATLEMRIKRNDAKGTAFADLMWKPRCLIEMKRAGVNLSRHYRQAFDYWIHAVPDRPRYVVLCNFDEFWVYDFDVQLDEPMDRVKLDDLVQRVDALSFLLPEEQKPVFGNDLVAVTRDAAATVARLFRALHERGIERVRAQRFVLQAVIAMFSEDIGLLPGKFFTRALEDASTGGEAYDLLFGLFREMNSPGVTAGGRYRGTPYFNGGIFEAVEPFELTPVELDGLRWASATNWAAVRPEIFGTLFEGSMAAGERHAQGAHFTSQADITKVVIPTIVTPWRQRLQAAGSIAELERALGDMYAFRVLDPACGSGNFLYVAYREMRRLEHEALTMIAERRRSADIAAQTAFAYVTPDHFYGIDINPFAVEVAKVTMMLGKKLAADELGESQQVLPLDNLDQTIIAADALFTEWPKADVVIGNPPYLGRRKMVEELGSAYTQRLAAAYPAVGGVSD
jgi:N-6 DNA Methylase